MNATTDIFDLLLDTCFTQTELRRRASLIKDFYNKYIYQNPKPQPQEFFTNPLDWQWFLTYQSPLYQTLNDPDSKNSLSNIDSKLSKIKTLTMFTAVPLPEDQLDSIVFRLRRDYDPHLLVESRIDPAIIGGCVLIKDGIVKDYSLRKKVSSLAPEIKKEFQEVLIK